MTLEKVKNFRFPKGERILVFNKFNKKLMHVATVSPDTAKKLALQNTRKKLSVVLTARFIII